MTLTKKRWGKILLSNIKLSLMDLSFFKLINLVKRIKFILVFFFIFSYIIHFNFKPKNLF